MCQLCLRPAIGLLSACCRWLGGLLSACMQWISKSPNLDQFVHFRTKLNPSFDRLFDFNVFFASSVRVSLSPSIPFFFRIACTWLHTLLCWSVCLFICLAIKLTVRPFCHHSVLCPVCVCPSVRPSDRLTLISVWNFVCRVACLCMFVLLLVTYSLLRRYQASKASGPLPNHTWMRNSDLACIRSCNEFSSSFYNM